MSKRFNTVVRKRGETPYVDIPHVISRDLGASGFIPVTGTIGAHAVSTSLVPVGNGRYRLYLDAVTRRKMRLKPGETVVVELDRDTRTGSVSLPEDFERVLSGNPDAAEAFGKLPEHRRNELLKHLDGTREPDLRARTIDGIIRWLAESGSKEAENTGPSPA